MLEIGQILESSFNEALLDCFKIMYPYIISTIFIFIIKIFSTRIIRFFCAISECTKKETKKRIKTVNGIIDFISNTKDFFKP